MNTIDTVLISIAAPGIFLIANLIFRYTLDLPRSSAADTLIAIAIFQIIVIGDAARFKAFIAGNTVQGSVYSVFLTLLLLTIFAWVWVLLGVEPKLLSYDMGRYVESKCQVPHCAALANFGNLTYPLRARVMALFLPLSVGATTLGAFLYGS
jgi:hypothetical protein